MIAWRRPWWRLKRTYVGAALAVGLWSWFVPAFVAHAGEDRCEFGSVGNDRYRQMLRDARHLLNGRWEEIRDSLGADDAGRAAVVQILSETYSQLAKPGMTPEERTALTHAVLRSIGAELAGYRRNGVPSADPSYGNPDEMRSLSYIFLHYHLNVRRYLVFELWRPWQQVTVSIMLWERDDAGEVARSEDVSFVAAIYRSLKGNYISPPSDTIDCPPVPTAAWQDQYLTIDPAVLFPPVRSPG